MVHLLYINTLVCLLRTHIYVVNKMALVNTYSTLNLLIKGPYTQAEGVHPYDI